MSFVSHVAVLTSDTAGYAAIVEASSDSTRRKPIVKKDDNVTKSQSEVRSFSPKNL
jgi:hypothetical protein